MKRHRQKPNEEYNFWQPATDMMSGLVFVLVLIIALLGLYLLSDYTGYEEASSVSSEGPSSSGTGWNNNDPGGWYYDGGTGDGDGATVSSTSRSSRPAVEAATARTALRPPCS